MLLQRKDCNNTVVKHIGNGSITIYEELDIVGVTDAIILSAEATTKLVEFINNRG